MALNEINELKIFHGFNQKFGENDMIKGKFCSK